MKVRIVCSLLGALMLSFGIATIVYYNYGMAALDTFIVSLRFVLGVSFTVSLLIIQFSILFFLLVLKKTFKLTWPDLYMPALSVVVISSSIGWFERMIHDNLVGKPIWFLILGFFVYVYGITLLVRGNIFLAPTDKILIVMERFLKHSYGFYKVLTDIIFLLISITLIFINDFDLKITPFTFFLTFFTGIFIMFFTKVNKVIFKL